MNLNELLQQAQQIQSDPKRFVKYADDPVGFCKDVLGVELWSKQQDVCLAVAHKRDTTPGPNRVAVRSGHSVGKTLVAACITIWWLYAREGYVLTTAPTWESVSGVLWREINDRTNKALAFLPGDRLQTELKISETWKAIGLSTNTPSAFQGRHHARLLAVVDEAPGVEEQIHLELFTCATGDENCVLMIGNPTVTSGTFYEAFKNPAAWTLISISCLDHPNIVAGKEIIRGAVTQGWIDQCRAMWGEGHPFWFSRVLGEFPRISAKGVIPLGWVEAAQNEEKRKAALTEAQITKIPRVGGLDVARYGDNLCVLTVRRGDAIEFQEHWGHLSLMETVGRAMKAIKDHELKLLVIDAAGVGAGVFDRLLELRAPVQGYNGGHRAFTPASFSNRRSEMWWALRTRLEKQRLWLPPNCEKLVGELLTPEYELTSSGRIKVETKEALLERGRRSPDFADSLILCFAMDENPEADLVPAVGRQQDPWVHAEQWQKHDSFDFPQLPDGF